MRDRGRALDELGIEAAFLLSINGVGEAKLERYGGAFLEVIAAA